MIHSQVFYEPWNLFYSDCSYYQKNCIENDFKVKISEFFYYNGDEENFDSVTCKDKIKETKEFKESKDYNWPFSSILTKDGKVCKMIDDKEKPSIGLYTTQTFRWGQRVSSI